jgi:probable DNA metabolism protein
MKAGRDFSFYLSMHRECNERVLARAGRMGAAELEVSLQREDLRIKRMVDEVAGEVHRMKAFVRLSSLGPCALFGFFKPRNKIGEYICEHFARRNAGMIVVLGSGSQSWISLCRNGQILRERGRGLGESLERLKSALQDYQDGAIADVEDLWQAYYDSQYCPERKNLAAFRRRMPRRDQEAVGLRLMQNRRNATLEDFLDQG